MKSAKERAAAQWARCGMLKDERFHVLVGMVALRLADNSNPADARRLWNELILPFLMDERVAASLVESESKLVA